MKTKPGEVRATRITDAEKLGLYPGCTTINGFAPVRYALLQWQIRQAVQQAAILQRGGEESIQDFISRVMEEPGKAEEAATLGTEIHVLADALFDPTKALQMTAKQEVFFDAIAQWRTLHNLEAISTEQSWCLPEEGVGGTADWVGLFDGVFSVIDWKTKKTEKGKDVGFYEEWNCQLAINDIGLCDGQAQRVSVVISTTEPGRIEYKVWEKNDPVWGDWGLRNFLHKRDLWYSPEGPGARFKRSFPRNSI